MEMIAFLVGSLLAQLVTWVETVLGQLASWLTEFLAALSNGVDSIFGS